MMLSEEEVAFHSAIGEAVANWAMVEHGLFHVVAVCFSAADWKQVGATFYSIENFRSKLAFVDRAVEYSTLSVKARKEWTPLRDRVTKFSLVRNKIVHGFRDIFPNAPEGRRYAIVPLYKPMPRRPPKGRPSPGSLCVRDIDLAARQFFAISDCLLSYYTRITGQADPFAVTSELPEEPRTLALIRTRLHERILEGKGPPLRKWQGRPVD